MTAALDKLLSRVPIHQQAFMIGSVAPDISLWFLSIGGIFYYHFILGWSMAETGQWIFEHLYFYNPFWLASHNLLHAPLLLLMGMPLVWNKRRNIGSISRWLFWFLLACLLHSFIDIFTHADDGPLLLFPFNWTFRFHSPISYWDPRYHGREFSRVEIILDGLFVLYLLQGRIHRLIKRLMQRDS